MKPTKTKSKVLEALHKSLGNITKACKAGGINRQTFYNWLKNDPDFAAEVEQVKEEEGDFVENALRSRIEKGDTSAIIFVLKTKYRDRGYVEKTEQAVDITSGGKPIRYADIMPHSKGENE